MARVSRRKVVAVQGLMEGLMECFIDHSRLGEWAAAVSRPKTEPLNFWRFAQPSPLWQDMIDGLRRQAASVNGRLVSCRNG